jgi:hypothetical protein
MFLPLVTFIHFLMLSSRHTALRTRVITALRASYGISSRTPLLIGALSSDALLWPSYLVEFRGLQPSLRLEELTDAYKSASDDFYHQLVLEKGQSLPFHPVISTFKLGDPAYPLCGYVKFPNEAFAATVAQRCALVRSIIEVWGNAPSPELACVDAQEAFNRVIRPKFPTNVTEEENSWRVNFRRYGRSGRSGLDFPAKRRLLKVFNPILTQLHGVVNLTVASHDLIYLEDWSTFHDDIGETMSSQQTSSKEAATVAAEASYTPLRSIIGRIIAEGPNIQTDFDIKKRPYIGTM